MTLAIKSQGTLVEIEQLPLGSGSWVEIKEMQSIPASGATKPEIDVTHLRSVNKEFLLGLADLGAIQFTGNYLGAGADPGQDLIRARYLDSAFCNVRITLSDPGITQLTFNGLVQTWDLAIQPDSKVDLTFTVKKSGTETVV